MPPKTRRAVATRFIHLVAAATPDSGAGAHIVATSAETRRRALLLALPSAGLSILAVAPNGRAWPQTRHARSMCAVTFPSLGALRMEAAAFHLGRRIATSLNSQSGT